MEQPVKFVQYSRDTLDIIEPDKFMLRPERGWVSLQRLCLFLLRKIGCEAERKEERVHEIFVQPENILEAIERQHHGLLAFYHKRGGRLLIGADDFRDLVGQERIRSMVTLMVPDRRGPELMGMRITIIPWMRGVLVLPKDFD